MSLAQELSLFLPLLSVLPDSTFHIKNVAAATNLQTLCERCSLNFWFKNGHSRLRRQLSVCERTFIKF